MVMLSQRRRSRQQGMEANESLQREREMAAMTLQHIHDGVIRIDSAGRIDYLNPMAATLLQTPPEQVIGQSVFAVFRLHFEMSQHMRGQPGQRKPEIPPPGRTAGKHLLAAQGTGKAR